MSGREKLETDKIIHVEKLKYYPHNCLIKNYTIPNKKVKRIKSTTLKFQGFF